MIADVVYPESSGTHIDGILRCSRLRWGGGGRALVEASLLTRALLESLRIGTRTQACSHTAVP
jgi:hypothetical protein